MNKPVCIVSPHENGFWMADYYSEGWSEDVTPDGYLSGSIGGSKEKVIEKAKKYWPKAEFVDGITGTCNECGEYHFLLEPFCIVCGGEVNEP